MKPRGRSQGEKLFVLLPSVTCTCLISAYISICLKNATNYVCSTCKISLNFSSLDKLVSSRKCKQTNETLPFFTPTFVVTLIYILASHSTEVEREEDSVDSGSAAKRPKLDPVKEPGTSGVTSTSRTMKGKVMRTIAF